MWVPCRPAPQTLSSVHPAQTGPGHTGAYHEARPGRQAALSKAFPRKGCLPRENQAWGQLLSSGMCQCGDRDSRGLSVGISSAWCGLPGKEVSEPQRRWQPPGRWGWGEDLGRREQRQRESKEGLGEGWEVWGGCGWSLTPPGETSLAGPSPHWSVYQG